MFGLSPQNQPTMNRTTGILLTAILLLSLTVWFQQRRGARLVKERDKYQMNSDAMLSDLKRWRVDSTTMAVDVKSLRLSVDEYERYRAEDAAKIKQMGVKIKNLEAAAKHNIEVNAPINATVRDSVLIRDTVPVLVKAVAMNTPHIQLNGIIENNSLIGTVHLPVVLHQAIWIEYKRRWLFWKKVKAVHQTITTDNPHVQITYSEYISIQK